jgi:hypothetical protein
LGGIRQIAAIGFGDFGKGQNSHCRFVALAFQSHLVRHFNLRRLEQNIVSPTSVADNPTYLKLQFDGGNTLPLATDSKNVWRWYALWNNASIAITDPATKSTTNFGNHFWIVAITFDRPINYGQVKIDGNGMILPQREVKDFSQRTIFVVFSGTMNGIVTIQAI